jgi:hypothetical protein
MCLAASGHLLVAEKSHNRVQEVRLELLSGELVRYLGEGLLVEPHCVSSSEALVAVSEASSRVTVLRYSDGSLVCRSAPGVLKVGLALC